MRYPMPEGYIPIKVTGTSLVIAMDFKHFNKECAPFIEYGDGVYKSGPLQEIPRDLIGKVCSVRPDTRKRWFDSSPLHQSNK